MSGYRATTSGSRQTPTATSVESIFNVAAFLRWAGLNLLLGSWDNYFATPANYYLYNSGRRGAKDAFMDSPYFTFIPWDYDNCFGIDYFGTQWQYTDLVDWPSNTRDYWGAAGAAGKRSHIPLVQNLLRHPDLRSYYLDHVEHLLDTEFTPGALDARMRGDPQGSLWPRIAQAAYLEADTPWGAPFTGRQFTNDEVYRSGARAVRAAPRQQQGRGDRALRTDALRPRSNPARAAPGHDPVRVEWGDVHWRDGTSAWGRMTSGRPRRPDRPTTPVSWSSRPLRLVKEAKIFELLDESVDRRLEASGVCGHEGACYVIFDNSAQIARIDPALSGSSPHNQVLVPGGGRNEGFEDIAYDVTSDHFFLLIEAVERRPGVFMAEVQEHDASGRYLESRYLDFPLDRPNKGLEGLACIERAGQPLLLGLCEGNRCKGGAAGRRPGGGRIQVFARGRRHWDRVAHDATARWGRVRGLRQPGRIR